MKLSVNGGALEVPDGSTVLQATRLAGVEVPTLCHDDRLKPADACRLCLVQVSGMHHLVPACATPAANGMEVATHTPEIEETQRTLLELLAKEYSPDAVERWPEKQFHRWLRAYGIQTSRGWSRPPSLESEQVEKWENLLRGSCRRLTIAWRRNSVTAGLWPRPHQPPVLLDVLAKNGSMACSKP